MQCSHQKAALVPWPPCQAADQLQAPFLGPEQKRGPDNLTHLAEVEQTEG